MSLERAADERFPQAFWGMVALAVGLVVSAAVVGYAVREVKLARDVVTVTGSAKRPIRSDYVVWRGMVSSQRPTMQEAYREVSGYADRLRAYFRQQGVPDSSIIFQSIQTNPVHETLPNGTWSPRIVAYAIQQTFEIRSAEVDSITALSRRATELINEGVPLQPMPPEYLTTKLPELRVQMLEEAAKDARARAEAIARSVGSRIGPVRGAQMGVFQVTSSNSTQVSDYGIYDTSSLDKDITAVVKVTFAVR